MHCLSQQTYISQLLQRYPEIQGKARIPFPLDRGLEGDPETVQLEDVRRAQGLAWQPKVV